MARFVFLFSLFFSFLSFPLQLMTPGMDPRITCLTSLHVF